MAGRMTGLTLFTPVRRRWHWFLWTGLKVTRHLPFMGRHILQFNFIKFVRWTVVPHLDGERLKLARTCSSSATSTGRGSTTSTRSRT